MREPQMPSLVSKPRFNLIELAIIVAGIAFIAFWYRNRLDNLMRAVSESPLPEVELALQAEAGSAAQPYRQAYEFSSDWFTYNLPVWNAALAPYKGRADLQYLEVGLYEGRSALWMLENILTHPTSRLVGIDIFDGPLKERYLRNLERSGAADRATTIVGFSQTALRKLPLDAFDIIYIDGSHAEDDVLEDAVLSFRLLKSGGLLIFDDYRWARAVSTNSPGDQTDFAKASIDRFAAAFADHLETVHNGYQLILRKR
jgi:predicted O-methyltransferase YrrM